MKLSDTRWTSPARNTSESLHISFWIHFWPSFIRKPYCCLVFPVSYMTAYGTRACSWRMWALWDDSVVTTQLSVEVTTSDPLPPFFSLFWNHYYSTVSVSVLCDGKMSQWLSGLSFAYEGARSEMAYRFSVGYSVGEWLLTLKQGSLGLLSPWEYAGLKALLHPVAILLLPLGLEQFSILVYHHFFLMR